MKFSEYQRGIPREGWIQNMPEDVYHGGPECSMHLAMSMVDRTPMHTRYDRDHPDLTDSDSKKFGRVVHLALLQPGLYESKVVVRPGTIKKRAGKAWEEFAAEHEGLEIITQDESDHVQDIVAKVRRHELARALLDPKDTEPELSGFFTDPQTGVSCCMRFDAYNRAFNTLVDVKTSFDNTKRALERRAAQFHYPNQQAWYLDGAEALGISTKFFMFVFVETDYPHAVVVHTYREDDLEPFRRANTYARELWAECTVSGEWPGYGDDIQFLEIPPWMVPTVGDGS